MPETPEELVLCLDSSALMMLFAEKTGNPGAVWLPADAVTEELWLPTMRKAFVPRPMAEESHEWRHMGTYTTLVAQGKVFTYRRGKSGSEGRLHGKLSIGVGGHVTLEDFSSPSFSRYFADFPIYLAAIRELNEEVHFDENRSPRLMGYVATSETPVDRVHLGAVYRVDLDATASVQVKEDCLADPLWMTRDEIRSRLDEFESWSQIAAREVLGIETSEAAR